MDNDHRTERILRRVLADPESVAMHYQPVIGFDSKRIVAAEALLRVEDDGRAIPPLRLVRLAVKQGLQDQLGIAVFGKVCQDKSEWSGSIKASVNVAPSELNRSGFAHDAEAIIKRWSINPAEIVFEITENWVTPDQALINNLERLVEIGCEVALDDFGTGFSSLSHLRTLPLTVVKLDRSFVANVCEESPEREIVRNVIRLSHALGHRVVAEGVERPDQLRTLESFGCDCWQGFLFSPAIDPGAFKALTEDTSFEFSVDSLAESTLATARHSETEDLDSFVFRRISTTRWGHIGGRNRGEGWAGIVDLDESENPILQRALTENVVRVDHTGQKWLLGPYHPASAAAIALDRDTVVIYGTPRRNGLPWMSDHAWEVSAASLAAEIGSVSPAKVLADELEQADAVHTLMTGGTNSIESTMRHVIDTVASSLSCEFGVIYLEAIDAIATTTSTPCDFDLELMKQELRGLRSELVDPKCVQDAELDRFPVSIESKDFDIRSWLLLPAAAAFGGVMLCAHTSRNPRGFTSLCQRLGRRLASTADLVLETAAEREALHLAAATANAAARCDPLTGLANRLAWAESLSACTADQVDVVMIDLDGLKYVNDSLGHAAGDRQICALASAVARACRPTDVAARLGGDEFGILLRDAAEGTAEQVVGRLVRALGPDVQFSHGVATRAPGEDVRNTVHRADTAMYRQKRSKRESLLAIS